MILNQKQDTDSIIIGEVESKQATINQKKIGKLQYLLTKGLYSDPIGAVIVEWTNNAVDSVVQAGKDPIENPVLVEIGRSLTGNYFFKVSDNGVGLSKKEFEDILMNYLTTTKDDDDSYIGCFGLGAKSFLSLERPAIFTCRKDGKECKFLVYQGEEFVKYDLLHEVDTSEGNGVICEITINSYSELLDFKSKALKKLSYYDTVILIIEDEIIKNEIFRNDIFQISENYRGTYMHLSLKDVVYDIDFSKLGLPHIALPICLRFGLSDGLCPTPSRESLIYNEHTKNIIIKKIYEACDWLIEEKNKEKNEEISFIDWARNRKIIHDNSFVIGKITLDLNKAEKTSNKKLLKKKVKDISLRDPQFYFDVLDYLLDDYKVIYQRVGASERRRYFDSMKMGLLNKNKIIVIDENLNPHLKRFLVEKYSKDKNAFSFFFVRKYKKETKLYGIDGYINRLRLYDVPKDKWRSHIQEFLDLKNEVEKSFIYELNLQDSPEYIAYINNLKEQRKKNRSVEKYIPLNKQKNQVTLSYLTRFRKNAIFSKNVYAIDNLPKNKYLTVLIDQSDKDNELYCKIMKSLENKRHIKFAVVGPREKRKIPKNKQFITMSEFLHEKNKPFKRLVTCTRIRKVLDQAETLTSLQEYFKNIKSVIPKISKSYDILENYLKGKKERELPEEVLAFAEAHNIWDEEIIHEVILLEKLVEEFSFIRLFRFSDWSRTEKEVKNIVNQIMLFRKLYKGQFDDFEIVQKQPEVLLEVMDEAVEDTDEDQVFNEETEHTKESIDIFQ